MECNRFFSLYSSKLSTRSTNSDPIIEGYFAVFNSVYDIFDGASETIAQGAFKDTLSDDIRALIDHDSRLVLARTKAGTLELHEDSVGLYGKVHINKSDVDAMNVYERVKRGDVNQCSFGFDILDEETKTLPNGDIRWTIKKVKLYEVSICTFPAYTETSIVARKNDVERIKRKLNSDKVRRKMGSDKKAVPLDVWKRDSFRRLRGGKK